MEKERLDEILIEIGRTPLLSADEEAALCKAFFYFSLTVLYIHILSKDKHFIILAPVPVFCFGHSRPTMVSVPELHDVKSAAVDLEMNASFLKIRCDGFPSMDFWV